MASSVQDAENRGRKLYKLTRDDIDDVPQSSFTKFLDLSEHSWCDFGPDKDFPDLASLKIEVFFTIQKPSDVKSVNWIHNANTGAYYKALWNVQDGTIFTTDRKSPYHALHGDNSAEYAVPPPAEPLPALHRWSDVTYLQWIDLCYSFAKLPTTLKRVVNCNITNEDTIRVLEAVFHEDKQSYPGLTLKPADDGFYAVLGTANTSGVAHLLSQHKAPSRLGHKTIAEIQIFKGGFNGNWYIVVMLKDHE